MKHRAFPSLRHMTAIALCVLPYLLPDALKLPGAVLIIQKLKTYVRVEQWTY